MNMAEEAYICLYHLPAFYRLKGGACYLNEKRPLAFLLIVGLEF